MTRHAAKRAEERGIPKDMVETILRDLRAALADPIRYHKFIDPMFKLESGLKLWRFRAVPGCFHYALASRAGDIVSIMTEAQMRTYKAVRKGGKFEKLDG